MGLSPAFAENAEWFAKQVRKARNGATIEVPAGDYDIKDFQISKSLKIVGPADGGAVFRSAETTKKGVLVPTRGASLHVENLTFRNTSSWDRNGAGIRHEGRNLTVVNCVFDSNEDGILSTGDPKGEIRIIDSLFLDNGFGDGQSHGIYVDGAALVHIQNSRFIGTRIGHHVKSLSDRTILEGSYLDDAYGRASYAVDASRGGDVVIRNNKIVQSADSDNWAVFNYDLTRGGEPLGLVIENNEIINKYNGGILLRNDSPVEPIIEGNSVVNRARKPLKM